MLRSKLQILTLASVFFSSSARIELDGIGKNGTKEMPFQIVISWYLKHAYSVVVQVIHRTESDSMYRYSAMLVQLIHEESDAAVLVRHHFIDTKDPRRFYGPHKTSTKTISTQEASNNTRSQTGGIQPLKNWKIDRSSRAALILLVPDETALRKFTHSLESWRRNRLRSVLIVVVPATPHVLCREVPEKGGWKESARRMLEIIWTEERALNRFLTFPTLPCVNEYLFAWNPFVKGKNGALGLLKRLKIAAGDPSVEKALSEFVITVKDMNGYPFRVAIFERLPTLLASFEVNEISTSTEDVGLLNIDKIVGLDGFVLRTLTSWMNCTVELHPPSDGLMYGYQLKNGTFVGMIGDLVYRRADFAANGVFLKDYRTKFATEFTIPIGSDSLCVVVPRASVIPQWLQIFQCFSPLVWVLLFVNIASVSLQRHILRILMGEQRPRRNLLSMIIEMTLIFVNSPQIMPRVNSERILVGFYLMSGVIIIGAFQGTLYEGFTSPRYYKDLNTLADLDESGLPIGTSSPNLRNIFGEDEDSPTLRNLRHKVQVFHGQRHGVIDNAACHGGIAAIERKNDLFLSINAEFLDEHGDKILHVVEECPRTYQLAYIVPSGAFFLDTVNLLLRGMIESGLIEHWYDSTVKLLIARSYHARAKKIKARDRATAFNLKNTQTSFIILIAGLLISFLVFLGENISFRYKMRRGRAAPSTRRASTYTLRNR